MIYQILFYLEKLVKTFWLFGDTDGASTTKMDECFWFDDFFSKAKRIFPTTVAISMVSECQAGTLHSPIGYCQHIPSSCSWGTCQMTCFSRSKIFSRLYILYTYVRIWELPFFSLDQKYRSKAKSSLHSFSVKPTYLSQMLPSLLPSRRLRINWS